MKNNFHGNKRLWDPAIKIRLESEMSWHLRWGNIRFLTGEESRIVNLDVLGGSWHRPAQSPGSTTFSQTDNLVRIEQQIEATFLTQTLPDFETPRITLHLCCNSNYFGI